MIAARQFLGEKLHDWEAAHIKSQQYDCLEKNCVTMTLVATQTLMGVNSQSLLIAEEG